MYIHIVSDKISAGIYYLVKTGRVGLVGELLTMYLYNFVL